MTNDEEKNHKKRALKIIKFENTVQNKILRLLDKQLQVLEDEVNLLKFKLSHNKLSDEELQAIHDELEKSTQI